MAEPRPRLDLPGLLRAALANGASDVHFKPGHVPVFRINGELHDLKKHPVLMAQDVTETAERMMDARQIELFKKNNEIDLAYSQPGVGRFRVNIFRQRGSIAIAMRAIPHTILGFADLTLPPVLQKICQERRGMILVTGATGSGKSTTLAAMIDYVNATRTSHIITIEDPIEFLIRDKKSIVSQREVGFDTGGFLSALRASLRQDPDVILVGEMRDFETINTALLAAETGHLVLSTLHTTDVMETVARILAVYPKEQQDQVRFQLSTSLKAILSQRLITRADGHGRVPAVEILVANARVRDAIRDDKKTGDIPDIISQGYTSYGMQTFDMSLMQLVKDNLISVESALENASNPGDFRLRLQGISGSDEARYNEYDEGQKKKKPEGGDQGGGSAPPAGFDDLIERFRD